VRALRPSRSDIEKNILTDREKTWNRTIERREAFRKNIKKIYLPLITLVLFTNVLLITKYVY
jgi:hypothetical protein